jgi:hypothetical protein
VAAGRNRNHPQRAAGSAYNFQRRRNDNGAGRRKLVEIAQPRQTKPSTTVHQVLVGEWWIESGGLAGIGSDRLEPDARDAALFGKEHRRFFREFRGRVRETRLGAFFVNLRACCSHRGLS